MIRRLQSFCFCVSSLPSVPSLCSNLCPVMCWCLIESGSKLHPMSHQYQPPPPLQFLSLPTGMCTPAVGVLQGKVHIRAHGSADKIITMVTTGCGSSPGTLGESHTDTNSLKGTHISGAKANIHTQTFTHSYRGAGRSQGYNTVIQHKQTGGEGKEYIVHIYRILYLCPHPNRKQEDINVKDVIT